MYCADGPEDGAACSTPQLVVEEDLF